MLECAVENLTYRIHKDIVSKKTQLLYRVTPMVTLPYVILMVFIY